MLKQEQLLTEVIVSEAIQQNLLTTSDINNDIVVVDGGDDGNTPIPPPDGVIWHCLAVRGEKHRHVQDETDPSRGLTFTRIAGALPFIQMPQQQSLAIMRQTMMNDIVAALEECEKLKKTSLI